MAARKTKKTSKSASARSRSSSSASSSSKKARSKKAGTTKRRATEKKASGGGASKQSKRETTAEQSSSARSKTKRSTKQKPAARKSGKTTKQASTTKATTRKQAKSSSARATRSKTEGAKRKAVKSKATKKRAKSKPATAGRRTTKQAAVEKPTAKKKKKKKAVKKPAAKQKPTKPRTAPACAADEPAQSVSPSIPPAPSSQSPSSVTSASTTPASEPQETPPAQPGSEPTTDELSTDELWVLYRRQASKPGRNDKAALEDLRNILIERHYPLVRYIAERLLQTLPKSIELDDLVSAGNFGLMDAIRGFDPYRGIKFKTYCSTRVRGAILDQLRSQDWVPRLVRLKASRIEKALQRLTAEYGREPTHAELAKSLEMDHTELSKEIQESRAKTMFSLSEKWEDDDGSVEKVEVLEDKSAIDPVGELNRRDLMAFITRALTHKERFIIEQYYQYGHTMREIGEMLALTESRVCQIHSNVMSRLKGLLGQRAGVLLGG